MNNNPYKSKKPIVIRIIFLVMLIGWLAIIYIKSNEPYQVQDIKPYLADWFPLSSVNNGLPHWEFHYSGQLITWKEPYVMLEFIFRKSAHVAEYAILTILWLVNLQETALKGSNYFISPALVLGYAASDEWHQTFIIGRTGHAIDVAVDAIGMLAIMLLWFMRSLKNRNRDRNKNRGD
jgi:VanZ family protein